MTDLDALFAIDRQCFRPGIAYPRSAFRYYLNDPDSILILAEDDEGGRVLGFVIAEASLDHGEAAGHIITIDVRPSMQRRGLGRMLMEAFLGALRAAGAAVVTLEVAADNDAAQAFYQQFGFSETGRIAGYYMGTLDALMMEKHLSD